MDPLMLMSNEKDSPLHQAARFGHVQQLTSLLEAMTQYSSCDHHPHALVHEQPSNSDGEDRCRLGIVLSDDIADVEEKATVTERLAPVVTTKPMTMFSKDFAAYSQATFGFTIATANHTAKEEAKSVDYFDVDRRDQFGRTALHLAARAGHYQCCQLLLDFGADPNALSSLYATPLHLTADHHVVQLLLGRGADLVKRDIMEMTLLDIAIWRNDLALVKLLCGVYEADLLASYSKGRDPSMIAYLEGLPRRRVGVHITWMLLCERKHFEVGINKRISGEVKRCL